MANNEIKETPKPISKKHLARLEREKKQNRILLISAITVVVAVVLLITYGILDKTVFLPNKAVAKVGKETITVGEFQKRVQYERLSMVENFLSYSQSYMAYFFQSTLVEWQNSLDNSVQFGSDVLDKMINESVLDQKAAELGITVSEEDITKELERGFGYFPNGTPTAEPTYVYKPTSTLSATQLAIVTITPTATEWPTATPEPVTPTPEIPEATGTPTQVPTATSIPPTPTAYTQAGFEQLYNDMITNVSAQFPYTEADFRAYVRSLLTNQKMFDYLTKDVKVEQDMVWARHILVATEEEARAIIVRLGKGEDFAAIAAAESLDTSNSTTGGDLGWFYTGQMVEPFETAAYALAIGEISEPVATDFGYHVIQVLGHEVRELTTEELDTYKNLIYSKYIDEAKAEFEIKKLDRWASVIPTTPAIPAEYRVDTTGQ
jgi:peptidyl-prolyl cis-trans isomerase D